MTTSEKVSEKDWVPVTDPMFLKEADVIYNILDEEGIPAKIAELNHATYRNLAPPLDTGQVLVPKHLHEKALSILKARETQAEAGKGG